MHFFNSIVTKAERNPCRCDCVCVCVFLVRARFLYILEHVFIANGKPMSAHTLNRLPVDLIESTKRRLPATINIDCAIFFCVLCGFVL